MSTHVKQKGFLWPTALAVSLVVSAIVLNWVLPLFFLGNWNDRSAFGQLFGPATALFTGVGIAGLLYTIRLQQAQILLAREQAQGAERSQAETQQTIERQLRILTEQLVVQAQSSVADRQLQVDRMFVDLADIRECFTDSVTLGPSDPRCRRALAACQCLANYFDTYLLQKGKFAQLYSDEAWVDYISGHFAKSPMLRRFVVEHPSWYTSDLVALASVAPVLVWP
jgi:hypothetical protein